jgi:SAM-dependent methyltransferase
VNAGVRKEPARQAHAVLDLPSREWKARKIECLLGLEERASPLRVLEVGTGSGGIAAWLGTRPGGRYEVDAVDVTDSRVTREGFRFQLVEDVGLPFEDGTFDVVLSNHVIEHVGPPSAQRAHLAELHRVLRADGVAYLAVPNRWMLVEPHFRLPFLSWLPEWLRSPYVRAAGKGERYDCLPLARGTAERLLADARFDFVQHCGDAIRLTFALERPTSLANRLLVSKLPDWAWAPLRSIFPTLIYTLRKQSP